MPIMSAFSCVHKFFTSRQVFRKTFNILTCNAPASRTFADKQDSTKSSKPIVGTENEERLRVRRARPADVPRLMRFVREHASAAWPNMNVPPSASHLVLSDYVARALAQGHSLLAEHQENRRGWSQIRGLALGISVCPWDAMMIERWARCIQCPRSRRLMHLTAYCLRAPALHDKYGVHNILQVILIVPDDTPNPADVVNVLAKNAIQRGRDVGFSVLRFDVTDKIIATTLEDLKLTKEWQLKYDSLPTDLKNEEHQTKDKNENEAKYPTIKDLVKNIIVYTSIPS